MNAHAHLHTDLTLALTGVSTTPGGTFVTVRGIDFGNRLICALIARRDTDRSTAPIRLGEVFAERQDLRDVTDFLHLLLAQRPQSLRTRLPALWKAFLGDVRALTPTEENMRALDDELYEDSSDEGPFPMGAYTTWRDALQTRNGGPRGVAGDAALYPLLEAYALNDSGTPSDRSVTDLDTRDNEREQHDTLERGELGGTLDRLRALHDELNPPEWEYHPHVDDFFC